MIYTLTFTPSIDYILSIDDFKINEVNNTNNYKFYPGGKGVNISRILNEFKIDNIMYLFGSGKNSILYKNLLDEYQLKNYRWIDSNYQVRINIKLSGNIDTAINIKPNLDDFDINLLNEFILNLKSDDYVIISGSIGLYLDTFDKILKEINSKGVKLIIDTTKNHLKCALINKIYLVKPNLKELEELYNVKIDSKEDLIKYGYLLVNDGAKYAIVSCDDGAYLFSKDNYIYQQSLKINVINTVGAGDSLVAGFIYGDYMKFSLAESLLIGVSTALSTVEVEGLAKIKNIEKNIDLLKRKSEE